MSESSVRSRAIIITLTLGLIATLVAACGSSSSGSSSSSSAILIGTTTPLTGAAGSTCKPMADGATAWFQKINADGGINGRKIDSKVLDDAYTAAEAVSNVRSLVKEGMIALFNGCGSLQPPAVLPILQQANVPYMFPYAAIPGLAQEKLAFLTLPFYADDMNVFTSDSMKRYGTGKVYVISQGIPGADQSIAAVQKATEQGGGTFLGSTKTEAGQSDWTPLILKIKSMDPDYVMIIVNSADAARIVTTMKAQNAYPNKWVLASNSTPTQAFLSGVGSAADGKVLTVSVPAPASDPAAADCVAAFKKYEPGLVPDGLSLTGCANAQALVTALKEAGKNVTAKSLVKVVEGWSNKQASPTMAPLTFSSKEHQGVHSLYVLGFEGQQYALKYKLSLD